VDECEPLIAELANFAAIPRDKKFSKAYAEYLGEVLEYLTAGAYSRSHFRST